MNNLLGVVYVDDLITIVLSISTSMFASRSHRVRVGEDSEIRSSKLQSNTQLPFKTTVKPNNGKSVGFGTVTRTNLKENATNHHPPRTGGKSNAFPSTPGLKRPQACLCGGISSNPPCPDVFIFIVAHQNTLKTNQRDTKQAQQPTNTNISRLLTLTNKTPYPSRLLPVSPLRKASSPIKLPILLIADESAPGTSQAIIPPSRSRQCVRLPRLSDQS